MIKKTLFIAVLISLLGGLAFAETGGAVRQKKSKSNVPAEHMRRINQWSNELKAAYEAKDMDKVGELVGQMDNFKARVRRAYADEGLQDGKKAAKDEKSNRRAQGTPKVDRENRGENEPRMRRPANRHRSDDAAGQDKKSWRQDQDKPRDSYRQSARRPSQDTPRQMRPRQRGQYQDNFRNCCCCCMQRNFTRRGYGMRNQSPQWQTGRRYQRQAFAGSMMGQRQSRAGQMGRQSQGPWAMQRQGNFPQQRQMARGFDRPNYEQKSWEHGQFRGPQKERRGRNVQRQNIAPSGNEWDW